MSTSVAGGLETTRRRGRRLAWGLATLAAAMAGSLALLRATSLRGLPDIGHPFDLVRFGTVDLPDDQNAFTFYRRAHERLGTDEPRTMQGIYSDWSEVSPESIAFVDRNREALAVWLEGTKRDRGVQVQPRLVNALTILPVTQHLRTFFRMAQLQAIRCEHEGDFAGAWDWYRANLRASRHSGQNGFLIERLVGIMSFDATMGQALRWSDRPEVDAALLRRALEDVLALDVLTPARSEIIRTEYFSAMNTLADAELLAQTLEIDIPEKDRTLLLHARLRAEAAIARLYREPERSRRVIRLLLANLLSASDLPPDERARRAVKVGPHTLFRPPDGEAPAISPEELMRWFDSAKYAKMLVTLWERADSHHARDEANRAALIVHLAEQLYTRERGKPPASVDDLVGPYLKAIPAGYVRTPPEPKSQGGP
jgi:hypothetical protein